MVDSFIGASVLVICQDDKKYKGFICEINIQASTIRLEKGILQKLLMHKLASEIRIISRF